MSQTLAQVIAGFTSDLTYGAIPEEVRDAAMMHIVDSIGVSLAGTGPAEDSGKAARRLARTWGGGEGATAYGLDAAMRPELAALLNGSMAQALEMDDKHGSSLARPGSTVVPAVLAVAEARNLTIAQAITATTAGYEVMIRLGFVGGERFLARGYHTSSLLGSFGAAAGVANLIAEAEETTVDALGICGTFASGIQESTRTGSTSKILHGGWGAHAGILAMDMARAGITGPDTVFEGGFGFFETHLTPITGQLDFDRAKSGYGREWLLPQTAFKPYPCCQLLHAFIEAGKTLLKEMADAGTDPDAITAIRCQLAEPGLTLVTEPLDRKKAPRTPHEARFSLPFGVAATLVDGDVSLDTFHHERLGDPAILRLAAMVESTEDPDSDYPAHCPAILEIDAAGKTYRCHVPYHPGCPEAPLSRDEVLDKFARNSGWLFGERARKVGEALLTTPHDQPLRSLIAMIKPGQDSIPAERSA